MVKLSIIIPVFNIGKYLSNCLESILNQDFKDLEIICVNDGSTDNSLEVLQGFKAKDERVIIIDKVNEGSGVARNTALAIAKGEYVFFVDGDDWLEKNSLEKMLTEADKLNTDILIFGGVSCYEQGSKFKKQSGGYSADKLPKKYFDKIFSAEYIKQDIFKFPSTAWTKLYRREFLLKNDIKFQLIKVGQDQLPFFHSMITAERIALLPKNLYCYRKNRKGAVTAVKKKKNLSPIYVFYGIEDILKKLGKVDEYKNIFVKKYFSKATSWLGKFQDDLKNEYFDEYIKLLNHIQSEYKMYQNFHPNIKDNYWVLKLKQVFTKFL